MLSLHLFDCTKVVALNSPNSAHVTLRTYSTNHVYARAVVRCWIWKERWRYPAISHILCRREQNSETLTGLIIHMLHFYTWICSITTLLLV